MNTKREVKPVKPPTAVNLSLSEAIFEKIVDRFTQSYKNPLNLEMQLLHPLAGSAIKHNLREILKVLESNPTFIEIYEALPLDNKIDYLTSVGGNFTTEQNYSIYNRVGFNATKLSKIYFDLLISTVLEVYIKKIGATLGISILSIATAPIALVMYAISSYYPPGPDKIYYATDPSLRKPEPDSKHSEVIIFYFLFDLAKYTTPIQFLCLTQKFEVLSPYSPILNETLKQQYAKKLSHLHFFARSTTPLAAFPLPQEIIYSVHKQLTLKDLMTLASLNTQTYTSQEDLEWYTNQLLAEETENNRSKTMSYS